MKKLASILLIVLYATTSSGASFHFHFCMGRFQGIGLEAAAKQTCDRCGMQKGSGKGCCSDIVKTFRTAADQSSSSLQFDFTQFGHTLPLAGIPSPRLAVSTGRQPMHASTGPPVGSPLPLFIRHRDFRI